MLTTDQEYINRFRARPLDARQRLLHGLQVCLASLLCLCLIASMQGLQAACLPSCDLEHSRPAVRLMAQPVHAKVPVWVYMLPGARMQVSQG